MKTEKTGLFFSAAAALLLFIPSVSHSLDSAEVVRGLEKKYQALEDLSATFVQESRLATLGRSRLKGGTISFKKPGRMRWEYVSPSPQLLVSDGKTLWFYQPQQKQVVIQELGSAFTSQTPLLFLFGEGELATQFTWEEGDLQADEAGNYRLELAPLEETPDLISLALAIRSVDYSVAASVLTDAFGNITKLEFAEEKENGGLDDGLFTFEIPRGTEVVRP